ncbi:MAG: phage tail assembly chaperone [Alphaproteobacteria bacterium]|nr:phage tail assembly chaperone [Alphaproteobacteria bacterium]
MANPHRGEVTLTFAGRTCTLRPTFHILATLEQRLGLTLSQLLCRVEDKGLLASEMLIILSLATRHDGSAPFDSDAAMRLPAEDDSLKKAMPFIARFLIGAMGGEPSLDFPRLMHLAQVNLGINPEEFWKMSIVELSALLAPVSARVDASRGAEIPQSELYALMAQFPDNHAA